jgi:hypothetical protein
MAVLSILLGLLVVLAITAATGYLVTQKFAGLIIAGYGALPEVGVVVDVELAPNGADLLLSQVPEAAVRRVGVLEVERHVPATVRVTIPTRAAQTREAHSADAGPGPEPVPAAATSCMPQTPAWTEP